MDCILSFLHVFAPRLCLTLVQDGDSCVMKLLRENVEINQPASGRRCRVELYKPRKISAEALFSRRIRVPHEKYRNMMKARTLSSYQTSFRMGSSNAPFYIREEKIASLKRGHRLA